MPADLTEFTSKVKKQGTMLCFPLGKTLGLALKQFGFVPDQPVMIRFSDERLEIRPLSSPELIREKLKGLLGELRSFREKIRGYALDLPAVPDEELENVATGEGELAGMLECLLSDNLDPAIRKLESVDELGGPERARRRPGAGRGKGPS